MVVVKHWLVYGCAVLVCWVWFGLLCCALLKVCYVAMLGLKMGGVEPRRKCLQNPPYRPSQPNLGLVTIARFIVRLKVHEYSKYRLYTAFLIT